MFFPRKRKRRKKREAKGKEEKRKREAGEKRNTPPKSGHFLSFIIMFSQPDNLEVSHGH